MMFAGFLVVLSFFYGFCESSKAPPLNGRYTRDIDNYDLLVPRKLTQDGKFLSFSIPHYFKHKRRSKRNIDDADVVHYGVVVDGEDRHLELWPNHGLLTPDAISERRDPINKVKDKSIKKLVDNRLCHFTGKIRDVQDSQVALSTCDGLAGYIRLGGNRYFVEPLHEHAPNKRGQHLHMLYERSDLQDIQDNGPNCGTEEDWREAWKKRLRDSLIDETPRNESKRGLSSAHRYLETLVVADKKFLEYHKNTDYELYIMTIMNMVSDYYHDASVGNQIDVVVVRVMYLEKEEEEIDLAISPDAESTLATFCKWQQSVNPKDIKNPNHHDIAILLTRYDICADNLTSCGLMGLAYVATACTNDQPCAINEDAGLILGVVVAHEIGHVLGSSHDTEEESGCKPQSEDQSYHVMSPFVHLHTNVWSPCSKTFITTFFDNDLGECLNDEPQISLYENSNMLPGSIYDAKYQCQIAFPGSSICQPDPENFCERLVCRTNATTCMTLGEPPVDGTKCGKNKWCYNKKCVEIGQRPEAVNGGWGEWGEFGPCSRTCGGGVALAVRDCNNPKPQHKGRFCLGERKKIKICNTQGCADGSPSFRSIQCTEFDDKPFQDKLYKWKPYMKEGDPCSLYCINNEFVYVKLAPRAKDGTRCKAGSKDMCIGGVCRIVGCDYVIDSDAIEDDCGVCKGDGTECKLIDKVYQSPPGKGYVKVAVIFRGCRNIVIEELKTSQNTIAVTGPDEKHYYLNANFTEEQDGEHLFGGVVGIYSHPEPDKELLTISGPLKENLVLYVVFYANENVGYRYKYAEPSSKSNYQPNFHWEFVDWKECSTRCDGGVEISEPNCIEEKAGLVSSSFCQAMEKPQLKLRKCNEQPCITKWRVGKWGKCLACKKLSGIRLREVECIRENSRPGKEDILVDDEQCKNKKPGTKELCNARGKCKDHKRGENDLPADMMKRVWLQTVGILPNAPNNVIDSLDDTMNYNQLIRDARALFHKRTDKCDLPKVEEKLNSADSECKNNKGNKHKLVKSEDDNLCKNDGPKINKIPAQTKEDNEKNNASAAKDNKVASQIKDNDKCIKNPDDTNDSKSQDETSENPECKVDSNIANNDSKSNSSSKDFESSTKPSKESSKNKLKVGSIAIDKINPEDIRLIEIPVKQSHNSINLTDNSFECMGDKLPDTLDMSNAKVHTGEDAANMRKDISHENKTLVESN